MNSEWIYFGHDPSWHLVKHCFILVGKCLIWLSCPCRPLITASTVWLGQSFISFWIRVSGFIDTKHLQWTYDFLCHVFCTFSLHWSTFTSQVGLTSRATGVPKLFITGKLGTGIKFWTGRTKRRDEKQSDLVFFPTRSWCILIWMHWED